MAKIGFTPAVNYIRALCHRISQWDCRVSNTFRIFLMTMLPNWFITFAQLNATVIFLAGVESLLEAVKECDLVTLKERSVFLLGLTVTWFVARLLQEIFIRKCCNRKGGFIKNSNYRCFPCVMSSMTSFSVTYSLCLSVHETSLYIMSLCWMIYTVIHGLALIYNRKSHYIDVAAGILLGGFIGSFFFHRTYLHELVTDNINFSLQELVNSTSDVCDRNDYDEEVVFESINVSGTEYQYTKKTQRRRYPP